MKRIFISYRRTDSITITGRIYDRLVMAFGEQRVFKDVDDIPLGQDFRKTLEDEVSQCDVLCVIIGKQWTNVVDGEGNRRLQDPNDFVSIEVAVGLNRPNVLVVPCLVNGASMPTAEELPSDLQDLRFRNAAIVRDDPDFNRDMNRLIEQIKKAETYGHRPSRDTRRAGTSPTTKIAVLALGIILVFIVAVQSGIFSGLSSSVTPAFSATPLVTVTLPPTDTPLPSATPSPEPTATSTPVEQTAKTNSETNIWSEPNVKTGKLIDTIDAGTEIIVIGDPVIGPILIDKDDTDKWYQIRSPDQSFLTGWIWIGRIDR